MTKPKVEWSAKTATVVYEASLRSKHPTSLRDEKQPRGVFRRPFLNGISKRPYRASESPKVSGRYPDFGFSG